LIFLGENSVARSKSSNSKQAQPSRFGDNKPTFIEPYLTATDKRTLSEYFEADKWGMADIERLVDSDYKFAWSSDNKGGGYKATLVRQIDGGVFILTGRGSTPLGAVYALLYRHIDMLDGNWANQVDTGGDEFFS